MSFGPIAAPGNSRLSRKPSMKDISRYCVAKNIHVPQPDRLDMSWRGGRVGAYGVAPRVSVWNDTGILDQASSAIRSGSSCARDGEGNWEVSRPSHCLDALHRSLHRAARTVVASPLRPSWHSRLRDAIETADSRSHYPLVNVSA